MKPAFATVLGMIAALIIGLAYNQHRDYGTTICKTLKAYPDNKLPEEK